MANWQWGPEVNDSVLAAAKRPPGGDWGQDGPSMPLWYFSVRHDVKIGRLVRASSQYPRVGMFAPSPPMLEAAVLRGRKGKQMPNARASVAESTYNGDRHAPRCLIRWKDADD